MTPLLAFEEDIQSLLESYKAGQIDYDEATLRFNDRRDTLLQAFLEDTPDFVLDAAYNSFCDLRDIAVEKGDLHHSQAMQDISEYANASYVDPDMRHEHETDRIANLMFIIPSPEAA